MTIPASDIVTVNPAVLGTGGSPLALNGVLMTQSLLLPTASYRSFVSAAAVSAFFGAASAEYAAALIYFSGFDNSTIKPGALFFAPFNLLARAAWVQSGSFAGYTLAQLQAISSGTLIVTSDGTTYTSSTINLSAASSFSNAATLITAAFTGASKPLCTWNPTNNTFSITSVTSGPASTTSAVTGTMATGLLFTSATGAIQSQGAALDTPASAMDGLKGLTQNWVDFTTLWEPVIADKTAFAVWTNAQNSRYMYVGWDTDAQAAVNGSTTCFGAVAKAAQYDGVMCVSGLAADVIAQGTTLAAATLNLAVFVLGMVASIDFSRRNGRITAAFKSQSGFLPTVTSQQSAANLLANGYSFYGAYATANDQFNFCYNGNLPGKWKWLDTFVDQVYLNSQLQLALLSLLTSVKSIPYTQSGYSLIRAAMIDPIASGLNFGSIRAGVVLSASQIAQVNQAAGLDAATIIQQQGYYLQILDPGAQVRGLRGTPVISFWYTDGGAVQKITVASIDIQ